MKKFDYSLDYKILDFRLNKNLYVIGKGEQGVLLVEPYKSEILPYWRFKTPEIALKSAIKIYNMFLEYLSNDDFPGADMARKFIQMGGTRSKRYSNHKSGKKYDGPVPTDKRGQSGSHGRQELPKDFDPIKEECSKIFFNYLSKINENQEYINWVKENK